MSARVDFRPLETSHTFGSPQPLVAGRHAPPLGTVAQTQWQNTFIYDNKSKIMNKFRNYIRICPARRPPAGVTR